MMPRGQFYPCTALVATFLYTDYFRLATDSTEQEITMAEFRIAHLREQGQDMIIVPLSRDFGQKSNAEQNEILHSLQSCARAAGLAGTVVPVWDAGGGRMGFMAPQQWRNFFASINLGIVAQNLNKVLTCG
jgi:hypothetical protein